jgi:hypothetical protein
MKAEVYPDDEKGLENFLTDGVRNKLVAARGDLASAELRDAHYLFTEMVSPLYGAVIIGGKVIGDGSSEEPLMPVLFVEQGGKQYALIISSDDEMNDGGRIMIERGLHAFQHPTILDGAR